MTKLSVHHLKYRPDIDGLRAIAIIFVVTYHAFPKYLPGGYIGVDLFFAISGYLIGKILFYQIGISKFSFLDFYSRRCRRILPSLLIVLIGLLALGWFVLLTEEYRKLSTHTIGAITFLSNYLLWNEHGYFDAKAYSKPLLHLWSLAIEEQFYIFFPLVLWFGKKINFNLFKLTVILGVISFLLNLDQWRRGAAVADFYSPQTRFWELMFGALLGYWSLLCNTTNQKTGLSKLYLTSFEKYSTLYGVLGAALIGLSGIYMHEGLLYPGFYGLVPIIGGILLIGCNGRGWFSKKVLEFPPLIFIGKISFPLYLWHWPLLVLYRIIYANQVNGSGILLIVLISIILSAATYFLVELPLKSIRPKPVAATSLLIVLIIGIFSHYSIFLRDPYSQEYLKDFNKIQSRIGQRSFPGLEGYKGNFQRISDTVYVLKTDNDAGTLFIGDSNVIQYMARFEELVKNHKAEANTVYLYAHGGCPPIPNLETKNANSLCKDLATNALKFLEKNKQIKTVVIAANWAMYFEGAFYFTNKSGNYESALFGSLGYTNALNSLNSYISDLKKTGANIILISNIPTGNSFDPRLMFKRNLSSFPRLFELDIREFERAEFETSQNLRLFGDLRKIALSNHIELINPMDYLCGPKLCPTIDQEGYPIYSDSNHLSPDFVMEKFKLLDFAILPKAAN